MKNRLLITVLLMSLNLKAQAGDWSYTQILTVHHLGKTRANDGLRRDSFLLEDQLNANNRLSIGYIENSEGRHGLSLGYAHDFYQSSALDITGKLQVVSNYKQESSSILPLPLLGMRYHMTKKLNLEIEGMYAPLKHQPYTLLIIALNIN